MIKYISDQNQIKNLQLLLLQPYYHTYYAQNITFYVVYVIIIFRYIF